VKLNRIEPAGPVQAYKTYGLKAPKATHWRKATCEEVRCPAWLNGWKTVVPSDSMQADYIRARSGRHFIETPAGNGLAEFRFPAGQRCFGADKHVTPLEREPIYIVRDGDWRGNPTGRRRTHARGADWVDDFGTHQLRIAEQQKRG
jgi:hypothetical protein